MTSGRTTGWCSPPSSERRSTPRNILRTIQVAAQKAAMSDIGVHTLPWLTCWDTARSRSPETSTGTPVITRHGQQLRAWPDSSVSWTNQPLLSTPLGGMKKAANDFCETASDLRRADRI